MRKFLFLLTRITAFVAFMALVIFRHRIGALWMSDPLIDLLLYIGGGVLTAILTILGGHVATTNRFYRWIFYVGGSALAAIIVITGIRNYRATLKAKTPEQIVMTAVIESNKHTDMSIDNVRKDLGAVRDDLKGQIVVTNKVLSGLDENIKKGNESLSHQFKTVKPFTPGHAKFVFSIWRDNIPISNFPLKQDTVESAIGDNSFSVEFFVRNTSDVNAGKGDMWIQICDGCKYTKEPEGFLKAKGQNEHFRTKEFDHLGAGVGFEKMTVTFSAPDGANFVNLRLSYSCDNCLSAGSDMQDFTIYLVRHH